MTASDNFRENRNFDPDAKEQQLRSESEQWDTSKPEDARPDDIPTIDLQAWLETGADEDLAVAAEQLRVACEETGFFSIIGHQVSSEELDKYTRLENPAVVFHPVTIRQQAGFLQRFSGLNHGTGKYQSGYQ